MGTAREFSRKEIRLEILSSDRTDSLQGEEKEEKERKKSFHSVEGLNRFDFYIFIDP